MTRNQIAYWEYMERKTADRNAEAENYRSHTAQEGENRRHNLVAELETGRHNKATENIDLKKVDVDLKRVGETTRHNLADERISRDRNKLGYYQADTSRSIAQMQNALGKAQLVETTRSNMARESIQNSQLYETMRHNRNEEYLGVANVGAKMYDSTLKLVNVLAPKGKPTPKSNGTSVINGKYVQIN